MEPDIKTSETRPAAQPPGWWLAVVRSLEALIITLFAALTLVVLWGVFSRYVMGAQSTWTDELSRYLLVWVSLLGSAVMFREHGHLGVDFFVAKFHPDVQRLCAILSELIVIAFALAALGIGGSKLMLDAFRVDEMTTALGIQVGYLHMVTPLSGLFFAAFGIEHLIQRRVAIPAAAIVDAKESS
ncbi:MAG: TRAP transporter small permease [Opitutaceae bacterium]